RERNDPHYIDYLDYYVMILYEAGKYDMVINRIEEEQRGKLPKEIQTKFKEIKRIAQQMNEWESMELIGDIQQAITDDNPRKQYYLFQKWQQLDTTMPEFFYDLLIEETIHPVIKTMILLKFVEAEIAEDIAIRKFTYEKDINPKTI